MALSTPVHPLARDPHLPGMEPLQRRDLRTEPSTVRAFVTVTVQASGEIEIKVDGRHYVSGPIARSAVRDMLKAISDELRTHLDVVVTESDGSQASFEVNYQTPSRFAPPAVTPPMYPEPLPMMFGVEAEGFVEGEDVEVAIIVRASSADGRGRARTIVDRGELPSGARGVVLLGAVSGTLHVERF